MSVSSSSSSSSPLETTMFWAMLVCTCTLQSMFHVTRGCVAEERVALLRIRSLLIEANHRVPASWGQYQVPASWGRSDDCCSWDRVTCDKDTARVSALNLSTMHDVYTDFYAIQDRVFWDLNLFSPFHELRLLDLSFCFASLQNFDGLDGLTKLRNLNLERNFVIGNGGDIMGSLGKLASLEVIDLALVEMNGTLQTTAFENLKNLRELHLQGNQLTGTIPSSLFELPHLVYLDMSDNLLQGHIPISPSSNLSPSLQTLILSRNKLEGTFDLFWLRNLTVLETVELSMNADLTVGLAFHGWVPHFQLRSLMLSDCNVDNSIISFLGTQHHLQVLDLSSNKLIGNILIWIFTNEATLLYLDLSNNLLAGSVDPMWWHQSNLSFINISMNHFEGQLPTNISSVFPNLEALDASYNNISGYIPVSLCNISSIQIVDLSNNKFIGEVHACLFTDLYVPILKLSDNNLGGPIFGGAHKLSVLEISLGGNRFEGTLPSNLSAINMYTMDLHDNNLSGNLTASYWNLPFLSVLNIASNNLTGEIDPSICKLADLQFLDLSDNKLMGSIPNCNGSLPMQVLSMSGNSISGIPSGFFNSSYMRVLDLRYNRFTGTLDWIQHLSQIRMLLLGSNSFEGSISPNICRLHFFTIIDISHNKLSGSLPPCIGGLSFGYQADYFSLAGFSYDMSSGTEIASFDPGDLSFRYYDLYYLKWFKFYTKGNLYTYDSNFVSMMFGIDLSGNMLSGEIPGEVGNVSHVKSLNLSHNSFTGRIPATLANMIEIESLDLSHNELNGTIPWELTQLSALEIFSVAYNNLSGCIPDSGQFGTFSMSSYQGNKNLQNMSLGHGCSAGSGSVPPVLEDAGEASDDVILHVVSAASFVLAFWATVAFSFCHPYGRSVMLKI